MVLLRQLGQAAEKQNGLGGIDAKAINSNRKGVMRQCRLHHHSHVVEAPVWIAVLAGAKIRTAEAEQTFQFHYAAFGCAIQGDSRRDLPQLPDGNDEARKVCR